jgi:UDP-N-acetylglucosamine 2-epimerase
MKILLAFGNRPEIIKLGPLCRSLSRATRVQVDVVWTEQHIKLAEAEPGLAEVLHVGFGRLVGTDVAAITTSVRELTSSDQRHVIREGNPFCSGEILPPSILNLVNA